jgi:uncharacterized protein YggU (UPF0235/DUF167 family)
VRRISVTVKPGSKNPGIESTDSGLIVRVRERAVEGAANDAVVKALAKHYDLPPSRITLVRGARSRSKLLDVDL